MLDQKTAQYYERLVDLAMNEERSKLEALNFKSKLIALALRQEYSKKELKALDGRQTVDKFLLLQQSTKSML